MEYSEKYKCNECGKVWIHVWDTEDKNNDYTCCPNGCDNFDFDEIDQPLPTFAMVVRVGYNLNAG